MLSSPHPAAVGVYGGTFDPIHQAHLRVAEEFAEAFGLSQVRLIPTGEPPHRNSPATPAEQRLAMVEAAIAGNPRLMADPREVRRRGYCYTIDTLGELKAELPPGTPLAWLVGADAFLSLHRWKRWQELLDLAHLAVAVRPGFDLESWQKTAPDQLLAAVQPKLSDESAIPVAPVPGRITFLSTTPLAISSTRLRADLAAGRSVRYLLPDPVLEYIERHHLYQI